MALIRKKPRLPEGTSGLAAAAFEVVDDAWTRVDLDQALPAGAVVVPLARLERDQGALTGRAELGVRLPSDARIERIRPLLSLVSRIEIEVPKFADGRVYTLARRLRDEGYRGELVAVGDVLRDQVLYYVRSGFDGLEIAPQKDALDALRALGEFSVQYQAAHEPSLPLSRRVER